MVFWCTINVNRRVGRHSPAKDERIAHQRVCLITGVCAKAACTQQRRCRATESAAPSSDADILVLGAGIIGLACAREILRKDKHISVTVLDAGTGLFAGASGAGQGYGTSLTTAWPIQNDRRGFCAALKPPALFDSRRFVRKLLCSGC
jgi:hypothetical protein